MSERRAYFTSSVVALLLAVASVALIATVDLSGVYLGVLVVVTALFAFVAWTLFFAAFRANPKKSIEGNLIAVLLTILFR
jgi:hypothetical protein